MQHGQPNDTTLKMQKNVARCNNRDQAAQHYEGNKCCTKCYIVLQENYSIPQFHDKNTLVAETCNRNAPQICKNIINNIPTGKLKKFCNRCVFSQQYQQPYRATSLKNSRPNFIGRNNNRLSSLVLETKMGILAKPIWATFTSSRI